MKSRIVVSLIASVFAVFLLELAAEIMHPPVNQAPALAWDSDNQLLIHEPNTYGTRFIDGRPVEYAINSQGWNFPSDYPLRDYSKHLAVVIGDSFVEALQVRRYESISGRLGDMLGYTWNVYGMGISGAPLSQYLQMARFAERIYHPDIIIVVLVHNDFLESYDWPDSNPYRSFWHTDGVKMIPPAVYHPNVASHVMASPFILGRLAVSAVAPRPNVASANWQMGIDVPKNRAQLQQTERITDYLFGQFEQVKAKTSLLFVMDGPRDAIERGDDPTQSPVFQLNTMARTLAASHGLRFVDLTQTFYTERLEWKTKDEDGYSDMPLKVRHFSFASDYHWNAYAHDLIARTILPHVLHTP